MDQTGISLDELAHLVRRVPQLAAEAEQIDREIQSGQAQAWAYVDAIRRAKDAASRHDSPISD